jgi:hypothetical protein
MLLLNFSLLNRGYILMNVLKALASTVSMCSLHVIFLLKITPRYFKLFTLHCCSFRVCCLAAGLCHTIKTASNKSKFTTVEAG